SSAVSLPEAPLLGVLPGTGGLTRLVDKRYVRRDIADYFCTLVEGVKGKRAVAWGLVDAVAPKSQFGEAIEQHTRRLVAASPRRAAGAGIALTPLSPSVDDKAIVYSSVTVTLDRTARVADLTIEGPSGPQPS